MAFAIRAWSWRTVTRSQRRIPTPDTALSLMRMALALLNKRGEEASLCAIYLQTAIDAKMGAVPVRKAADNYGGHGRLRGH